LIASRSRTDSQTRKLNVVTVPVTLRDEVGPRLLAEAARRGVTPEQLAAEMLDAQLPRDDALEAFIGSGHSGRAELLDLHTARREAADRKLARSV
jgi:hypothetical protein